MSERQHTVTFSWTRDVEGPEATVQCPWRDDDPEKPCRVEESDDCAVQQYLDGAGYEAVGLIGDIVAPPLPIEFRWHRTDEFPEIGPRVGGEDQ